MHHSLLSVPLAVAAAMVYAQFASSRLNPGLFRLAALLPVLVLLLVLPIYVPLYSARGTAAFSLAWLAEFKLLLLAFGRGPLDSSLPPLRFVFTAAFPVKLLHRRPDDTATKPATSGFHPLLLSSSIKVAVMAGILHLLQGKKQMNPYVVFSLYAIYTYCFLDFLLPCLAATGRALGMQLEPTFDKPYLSASLQDFWGRRWNLMASAVLRSAVYDPVRACLGAPAAVLTTFLVSGLMHEVVVYYITFRAPTGKVTAFFALHGACVCAERWCAHRFAGARPTRALATPLVVGFVAGTAFWLFFPAVFGRGMDDKFIAEFSVLVAFFAEAGRRLVLWR